MHQIDMHLQKCRKSPIFSAILGRSLLMGLASTLVVSPNSAHADESHYRVDLVVAKNVPACDRKLDFIAILTTLLAKPLLDPPETRLFEVRISKPTSTFHVDLVTKELDGREIDSTHHEFPRDLSCFEVLYKAALRTAIRMEFAAPNTEEAANAPAPATSPPPPPATPLQCPPSAPEPPKPRKIEPIERHWFVGAGGIVAFGMAPEIIGGGFLLGGWRSPSWSVEANLSATFPQDTRPSGPTIVQVQTVFSVGVAPCFRSGPFGLCGMVDWGTLSFDRHGTVPYSGGTSTSFRVGLRGFMAQRLTDRWSLRVNLDLTSPILRSNLRDEAHEIRWQMPALTGTIGGAIVASF